MIACTIELFGVARLVANTRAVPLELEAGATIADAFARLAQVVPALRGRVIAADDAGLVEGYACSRNGLEFVRSPATRLDTGDTIAIISADAGG